MQQADDLVIFSSRWLASPRYSHDDGVPLHLKKYLLEIVPIIGKFCHFSRPRTPVQGRTNSTINMGKGASG